MGAAQVVELKGAVFGHQTMFVLHFTDVFMRVISLNATSIYVHDYSVFTDEGQ